MSVGCVGFKCGSDGWLDGLIRACRKKGEGRGGEFRLQV